MQSPKLIKTKWGYRYHPMPSAEELKAYYSEHYYQKGEASYEVSYSQEEIDYFKLKAWLIRFKTTSLSHGHTITSVLDVGCGEGWLLNEFYEQGMRIAGVDFSEHALSKFHPYLLNFFEQGDFYEVLVKRVAHGEKYDVLTLTNVLEHVADPTRLIDVIKKLMHNSSRLVIVVPNDFSYLHEHLLKNKFISKKFWLTYPDHLHYFNKKGMESFISEHGLALDSVVAENPVDINILNKNSNYIEDKEKGKNIHFFRIRTDNFLASIDREKLLQLYEVFGSMGVGRDLQYYCRLQ